MPIIAGGQCGKTLTVKEDQGRIVMWNQAQLRIFPKHQPERANVRFRRSVSKQPGANALRLSRLFILGLALIGFAGCSTLESFKKSQYSAENMSPDQDLYLVEYHGFRGEPTKFRGKINPAPPNPTTVQTALEESGTIGKLRKMDINVYRRVPGSPQSLKMPVTIDPQRKAVTIEQDYAIHPGDRIVIEPGSPGPLGKFLDSM